MKPTSDAGSAVSTEEISSTANAPPNDDWASKMRSCLISCVNPRLVLYNRPLLLASLITVATIGATAGLYAQLVNTCIVTDARDAYTQLGTKAEHEYLLEETRSLIGQHGQVLTNISMCVLGTRELDTFPVCAEGFEPANTLLIHRSSPSLKLRESRRR